MEFTVCIQGKTYLFVPSFVCAWGKVVWSQRDIFRVLSVPGHWDKRRNYYEQMAHDDKKENLASCEMRGFSSERYPCLAIEASDGTTTSKWHMTTRRRIWPVVKWGVSVLSVIRAWPLRQATELLRANGTWRQEGEFGQLWNEGFQFWVLSVPGHWGKRRNYYEQMAHDDKKENLASCEMRGFSSECYPCLAIEASDGTTTSKWQTRTARRI